MLIFKGKADLDLKNKRGDSPLQLLQQHIDSKWITKEVIDLVRHITQQRSNVSILMKITMNQRIKWYTYVCIPFVFLFAIALILSADIFLIFKIVLIVIVCAIISVMKRIMLDDKLNSELPLVYYWASKVFFYVSWAIYVASAVSTFTVVLFLVANILLWICFITLWKGDPGVIKASLNDRLQTIIEIAEHGDGRSFEPTVFCSSCLIKRPSRSKHCAVCDRCVGLFDHHCPWTGSDVGYNNHRIFIAFLFLILSIMILNLYGGITYYVTKCNLTSGDGIWNTILIIDGCAPWIIWMILNANFHLLWVLILTTIQIYQIVFIGMTTNERINRGRYKHFVELGGKSPFHQGPMQNIAEFFRCSFCGLFTLKRRNWMVFSDKVDARIIKNGSLIRLNEGLEYV
jgi:palmitoyltransferase